MLSSRPSQRGEANISIAEAALYGDLVKYLRDGWAAQAAEFNESSVAAERERVNEVIRQWFFAPQAEELYGLTPRDVIRNEQMNRPNVIPRDKLRDALDEDYDFMIEDGLLTEENMDEWNFGYAPDMCLLDEYDPEGYDARWASDSMEMEDDPDERITNMPPQAAREWLTQNGNPRGFAGNRFYDNKEALDFVERLYDLGAARVWVDNIYDEPYRLRESGGPYADTFIVELPDDSAARVKLYEVFDHELRERQGLELARYIENNAFYFGGIEGWEPMERKETRETSESRFPFSFISFPTLAVQTPQSARGSVRCAERA